jgi:hypothetical protein
MVLCNRYPGATEPQYGFGAATPGGHLHTEIKSEHVTNCRLRQALESGKKAKTPRIGGVCRLTKGVLIRVSEIVSLHVAKLTEALTKGIDEVGFEVGDALPRYPVVAVSPACCALVASGTVSRPRTQRTRRATVLALMEIST